MAAIARQCGAGGRRQGGILAPFGEGGRGRKKGPPEPKARAPQSGGKAASAARTSRGPHRRGRGGARLGGGRTGRQSLGAQTCDEAGGILARPGGPWGPLGGK